MTASAAASPGLVGYAESPRSGDWTLRSALVRYAQPEPQRASVVLELVRRLDGALAPDARSIADGEPQPPRVEALLAAAAELDRLADVMAEWAVEPASTRPDATVDEIARHVFGALAALEVPRESRPPRRT